MNEPDLIYQWDFFLAHAGADSATARALYEALSPTTRVFLDERSMLPGDPWTRILPAVLRETRITVVLVSTHTRDAWYEDSEIRIALDLLRDYPGRYRVIALLLDEAEPIRRSALPYGLEQTVTLSWSTCGGVQQVARRLVATLRADEDKRSRHNDAATAPEVLPLTDSVTAFVGQTERGPTWPMLITSWEEFTRSYGQPLDSERTYLPVAVRGFFQNGGDRAYVARVLTSGAACAFLRIATADRHQDLVLTARNAGSYGNTIRVGIGPGSRTGVRVRIREMPNAGLERTGDSLSEPRMIAEDYDNVSPNPSGPNPLLRVINRSELVSAEWGQPGRPEAVPESGEWNLSGGADGWVSVRDYIGDVSVPGHDQTALASLRRLEDVGILCVPDAVHPRFTSAEQEELTRAIVRHCERQRCFAILATAGYDNQRDLPATLRDTSAAAIYFPWVTVPELAAGTQMRVPPVGHIAGVYVRHDRQRGVHVSPLGIELKGLLFGPTEPDFHCSTDVQAIDDLVRRGFNVLCRDAASPGQLALGSAVTMAVEESMRPVGVRRFLNFVERSLIAGTAWAALAPNNEATWKQLREELEAFLLKLWRAGVLRGSSPEEAFFVRCDSTTMTDDDIATGRVNCVIGVALADSKLKFPLPPSIHTQQRQSEPPPRIGS